MRQRIGTRLISAFLIGAAITMLVGAVAVFAQVRVNNNANAVLSIDIEELAFCDGLAANLAGTRWYEREFFMFSEVGNPAKQKEYSTKLDNAWEALAQDAEAIWSLPEEAVVKDHADELTQLIAQSRQELTVVKNLMLSGRSYEEVQPQYQEYRNTVYKLEDLVRHMSQHAREILKERQEGLIQTQATLRDLVIATVAVAVILAFFLGIALTRSITRPVSRLSEVTKKIAAGDLNQRAKVTSKDELGELATSFNQMTESLQKSRDEIQEKNQELEAMNEELKASNEELRQTQEKLIRSERLAAIGQLAGGVGHELRNPLGALRNAVYYVKGKVAKSELAQKEPRVMEFLGIMDDEINSSNKIINDLLGFSRVGKPSVSPTQIRSVIEEALLRMHIPENIELTKKLDAELPQVEVDPDQIQQVLVNMITNAVQATPDGGKLTISARERKEFLEVEIADTGEGIPEETRDKIFDPLFTTRAKGIGLGLAVCKSIIDRHGGNIEVKSKVGKGTTLNIKLPLRAAA
ncbi:MAG: ATP-binding protein [Dehalococcoidales bacterium]